MTGRNWDKAASRARVARQGSDAIGRRARGARKEAADAEMVSKVLRCACGHRGRVELPAAMLAGKRFKCSRCGRSIG